MKYDFPGAQRIAAAGKAAHCPADPVPCAYFRVLQGEVDAVRGEPEAALNELRAPLPAPLARSALAVRRLYAQAVAAVRLDDPKQSSQFLAAAEELARKNAPAMTVEIRSLRAMYSVPDEPRAALAVFEEVLEIARHRGNRFLEAAALGNSGYALMHLDRWTEALDRFEQSRRIFREVAHEDDLKTIGNIAKCYRMIGDYDQAAELYRSALRGTTRQMFINDRILWMTGLAEMQGQSGNRSEAREQLRSALQEATGAKLWAQAAAIHIELAALSFDMKDYLAAEENNARALRLLREAGKVADQLDTLLTSARLADMRRDVREADEKYGEVARKATNRAPLRWEAHARRAMMYARLSRNEEAEEYFRDALRTVDEARHAVPRDEHQLSFGNLVTSFFGAYIDFLADRGRDEDALSIAEHARAQTLEEALQLDQSARAVRPREAAEAFGGVILSYWLGEERSHLWVITARDVRRINLPPRAEIDTLVAKYGEYLEQSVDPLGSATGARLYDLLVAPAGVAPGTRVAIVPAGRLYQFNFETLVAPAPQRHFWIEDVTITTSSSVALLAAGSRRKIPEGDNLLLVGDVPSPDPEHFSRLRNARKEVQLVAAHFPEHEILQEKKATPTAYAQKNPQSFAFIHFVAHGVPAALRPLDSSIILARDGANNYRLLARDVINQPKLHARLVTISSCHGAGVRAYAGEGLVGLAWAFLRAGSHQVIAALWQVNDSATPDLMDTMYAGIRQGRDPASALRQAKLRMIRSGSLHSHPRYWAPFVLYSGA
jgi:CHAT domain-containing protein